jgi:5-oxopent-3-ene-1,2,5-tricarboxylate decarboxylase/2-hydroxyhepta-2,4-diene-1,7-dioate isomerase
VVPASEFADPDHRTCRVAIDGEVVDTGTTADRVRGVARLLVDVTAFMTLQPGDVLSLGRSHGAPLVGIGQRVELAIEGLGSLQHTLVAERAVA